jgi:hypothetical protein
MPLDDSTRKPGRPRQALTPEEEAARQARRRRQLADAQARRRRKLLNAAVEAEGARQAAGEIDALRARIVALEGDLAAARDLNRGYEARLRARPKAEDKATRFPAPLPGRIEAIVREMTHSYDGQEKQVWALGSYSKLAAKFTAEAKTTATAAEKILGVAVGIRAYEGKTSAVRFGAGLLSREEEETVRSAAQVLRRFANDVDTASDRVADLHKRREAEDQQRLKLAGEAIAQAFGGLSVDDRILVVAAEHTQHNCGWGKFSDLVDGIMRPEKRDRWWKAGAKLSESFQEWRGSSARRVADQMRSTGRQASDIVGEALRKFHETRPKIEAEWPDLVRQVKAQIVIEELQKTAPPSA